MATVIQQVNATSNFYTRLGVSKRATAKEIRKSYLLRSRICHPDRTSQAQAKEAFQKLSIAYRTLHDPLTRLSYDMYGRPATVGDDESSFTDAVRDVFVEFLEGNFDSLISVSDAVNRLYPGLGVDQEAFRDILSNLRSFVLLSNQAIKKVQFDVLAMMELYAELVSLSIFNITGRIIRASKLAHCLLELLYKCIPGGGGILSRLPHMTSLFRFQQQACAGPAFPAGPGGHATAVAAAATATSSSAH